MDKFYTIEEIKKAINVSNGVYEEIETLFNHTLSSIKNNTLSLKEVEELLIDIDANIYAHWEQKQKQLNVLMVINDSRYTQYREKIHSLIGKDFFNHQEL